MYGRLSGSEETNYNSISNACETSTPGWAQMNSVDFMHPNYMNNGFDMMNVAAAYGNYPACDPMMVHPFYNPGGYGGDVDCSNPHMWGPDGMNGLPQVYNPHEEIVVTKLFSARREESDFLDDSGSNLNSPSSNLHADDATANTGSLPKQNSQDLMINNEHSVMKLVASFENSFSNVSNSHDSKKHDMCGSQSGGRKDASQPESLKVLMENADAVKFEEKPSHDELPTDAAMLLSTNNASKIASVTQSEAKKDEGHHSTKTTPKADDKALEAAKTKLTKKTEPFHSQGENNATGLNIQPVKNAKLTQGATAVRNEALPKEAAGKVAPLKSLFTKAQDDDIPLLCDDATGKNLTPLDRKSEHESDTKGGLSQAESLTDHPARPNSRYHRPTSRRPSRPLSRLHSMNVVDFPQGDEMKDELTRGGLSSPAKQALEAAREERMREREALRQARLRQRAAQEEAERQRDELARQRRGDREEEERKKRELVAKMDEERRKLRVSALAKREQEKEADKRKFEEARKIEEAGEEARIKSIMEDRSREMVAGNNEPQVRSVSRPRSRRPSSRSRPLCGLHDTVSMQASDATVDLLTSGPLSGERHTGKILSDASRAAAFQHSKETTTKGAAGATAHDTSGIALNDFTSKLAIPQGDAMDEPNPLRTLVVVETMKEANHALIWSENEVTYKNQTAKVTEVKGRKEGTFEYSSVVVQDLCKMASKGYNVAMLSSEAPNTCSRFASPVWTVLTHIVRKILADHTNENGQLHQNFELSCALGYVLNDKCKDIFAQDDVPFKPVTIKSSPIYGPNLSNLQYYRIIDAAAFQDHLVECLGRASENAFLSTLTEGFIGAFLNMRQDVVGENGERDVRLSSISVTSAGSDVMPYADALQRKRNIYGSLFHLCILGPCFTCYMFNTSDDDSIRQSPVPNGSTASAELEKLCGLLQQLSVTENLPLRSGSVRRFLVYVSQNYAKTKTRLASEGLDDDKRQRIENYLVETKAIMDIYSQMIDGSIDAK